MPSFKTSESTKAVVKNMEVLKCFLENCDVEVQVHKKNFASLSNCGREDCPNGTKRK